MSPFLAAMKYLESVNEGFHGMTFSESKDLSNENENENNCDDSNNIDYKATNGCGNGKIITSNTNFSLSPSISSSMVITSVSLSLSILIIKQLMVVATVK